MKGMQILTDELHKAKRDKYPLKEILDNAEEINKDLSRRLKEESNPTDTTCLVCGEELHATQ